MMKCVLSVRLQMICDYRNAKTKAVLSQMMYELRNAGIVKSGFREDPIN